MLNYTKLLLKLLLKKNDVLFAGSGETIEEIGKSAAFISDAEVYAGSDIIIFRPNNMNGSFLGYLMNSLVVRKQLNKYGTGATVMHIYKDDINKIMVPYLDKQKQDMKLKNVHFLGKRNDIIDIYSACDLFYLPSLGEGLPGTVMEAMACGKPIVATKENGTIDLVTKDVGLLVKQDGDYIKAFEIAINTKFNSKKIINQIKKYDWTKSIKNYAFFSNKKK